MNQQTNLFSAAIPPAAVGPATPPSATFECLNCGFDRYVDASIHNGASIRRDCARCGRTAGFPTWNGAPGFVETRRAAASSIALLAGGMLRQVFDFIRTRGEYGATDEETGVALAMQDSTVRPRRVELRDGGQIRDSGLRRKTNSGRDAIVWVATGKQLD